MPVGGVHVDPANHEVWAASDPGEKNRSELLHFDASGKLLERFPAPGPGPHDFNDLALRNSQEIYTTDTEANVVFRFDRKSHNFAALKFPRAIFYPNGITVSGDGNLLYAADMIGVIVVDLRTNTAQEVIPDAHDTLSGIDGLYWYKGDLVGIQYGTAAFRVMRWHLAKDGRTVASNEVLERGTDLVKDPTTGAIFEDKFYFMANTGIDNLEDDKIVDESKLEPVQIAVVALR
jgi:DNA-binding beta-propeller fold protein YncE